jgi:hypothetical protein
MSVRQQMSRHELVLRRPNSSVGWTSPERPAAHRRRSAQVPTVGAESQRQGLVLLTLEPQG